MGAPARLITIPFSHYCEKARWALDYTGLPYVEDRFLPMMHMTATIRAGGKTVPVLVTRHGSLTDSAKIVSFADNHAPVEKRLYPREEPLKAQVDELERLFNDELAPATRLFGYFHGLPRPNELASLVAPGLTAFQRRALPLTAPLVAPLIRRRYKIAPQTAEAALALTRRVFADLGARLAGKRYFVGDRFTAADLTFAAVAAPVLLPEGHPAWSSDLTLVPDALRAAIQELRATRAGEHVASLYREHRGARGFA
jgi:glutathione S-transferase